jgi:hypothetical protein
LAEQLDALRETNKSLAEQLEVAEVAKATSPDPEAVERVKELEGEIERLKSSLASGEEVVQTGSRAPVEVAVQVGEPDSAAQVDGLVPVTYEDPGDDQVSSHFLPCH